MQKVNFGYNNDFSGQARVIKSNDFTAHNIKNHYQLDKNVDMFVRNDGAMLYQDLRNGRCYVSSNRQYSYSLTLEPGSVILKF